MNAKDQYDKAYANLGGVGFACFTTSKEQDAAFQQAFEKMARAAQTYIPELRAEIERLRQDRGDCQMVMDGQQAEIEMLRSAVQNARSLIDRAMGDTDPQDENNPLLLACQALSKALERGHQQQTRTEK